MAATDINRTTTTLSIYKFCSYISIVCKIDHSF